MLVGHKNNNYVEQLTREDTISTFLQGFALVVIYHVNENSPTIDKRPQIWHGLHVFVCWSPVSDLVDDFLA